MNLAHVHLVLNHAPIIGIPIALTFLIYGIYKRERSMQRFSLLVMFAIAALVLPVYFTGEPAEHVVKQMPGVTEAVIEPHEDAAMISLILTLVAGAASLLALFFQRDEVRARRFNCAVAVIAVIALGSLVRTANLGGQIRHTEIRPEPKMP